MNNLLFRYALIVFLIALSPCIYGAQAKASSAVRQIAFHPDVEWVLKTEPPLSADTKQWLHSPEALAYCIHLHAGYHRPLLVDLAAGDGRFQEIAEFLSAGADVNAADSRGSTAIAHSLAKPLQLQLLLDYKAEVNVSVNEYSTAKSARTLLSTCCRSMRNYSENEHRESLTKLLSDPRIDVDKPDADGGTPLHAIVDSFSLNEKDLPFIQRFIDCGANPLCRPRGEGTAFDCLDRQVAVFQEKIPLCKAILQLFDQQRKAAVGFLPALLEYTTLVPDTAKLVVAYTGHYPAFTRDSKYHVQLDALLKEMERLSAAS